MNEKLEQILKELQDAPGIYQMLDKNGNIIYIGKSKCLKKRVNSYFVPSPVWDKAKQMAPFIVDLNIIVTDTHLEAMLLECEQIKKIKPHFNSMMKNDRKYMFLTLEENYRRNSLKITGNREGQSFGPFRSKGILQDTAEILRNLYPITKDRTTYHIEYHVFPCEMDSGTFEENRKTLAKIFTNKTDMEGFQRAVSREMKAAAKRQSFERAMQYRDLLEKMDYLWRNLKRFAEWKKKDIIYEVPLEQGCKLFYISDGLVLYSEKAAENTEEVRKGMTERVRLMQKGLLRQDEKELLDYRDIVYTELTGNTDGIYEAE